MSSLRSMVTIDQRGRLAAYLGHGTLRHFFSRDCSIVPPTRSCNVTPYPSKPCMVAPTQRWTRAGVARHDFGNLVGLESSPCIRQCILVVTRHRNGIGIPSIAWKYYLVLQHLGLSPPNILCSCRFTGHQILQVPCFASFFFFYCPNKSRYTINYIYHGRVQGPGSGFSYHSHHPPLELTSLKQLTTWKQVH